MFRPTHTSALYGTWLKEVAADGATDVREQPGTWSKASTYRDRRRNYVLVEDHGVLFTLASDRLDTDQLVAYAREVAVGLRKK